MQNFRLRNVSNTLAVSMLAVTPILAHAVTLEEIVVTATKRAESIQDVPVSVSTLSADTMTAMGVTDMEAVTAYIPNFEFSAAGVLPNLYVRGIGSGTTHSIEQSVGRFVDDVYIGRAAINLHTFMDVSNVEVLRGPQGTLFGKNTLGGAMIVHTGKPTEELSVGLKASTSNYSTVGGNNQIQAHVSGALTDTLRARVAFLSGDKDGFIDNDLAGPNGLNREETGARVRLEWDASEQTTVGLKLEYMEFEQEGQSVNELVSSKLDEADIRVFDPDFSYEKDWKGGADCTAVLIGTTFCPSRDQFSSNVTFDIAHELDGLGTFQSITAYQHYEYNNQFAPTDTGIFGGTVRAIRNEEFKGFSQEFRFTSELFEKYDYIVGAYYENSELTRLQYTDINSSAFGGSQDPNLDPATQRFSGGFRTRRNDWNQDTDSIAVFGQVRVHLTDTVSAIIGGRWGREKKDFFLEEYSGLLGSDPRTIVTPGRSSDTATPVDLDRTESKFTPSLTIRWEPNEDQMLFATLSQGHKTGGFSDRPQANQEFDSELNTSFEVGMKSVWLDGALETNIALYYMEIEDLQVARALGDLAFEVQNAAEATIKGLEFEGRWQVADNWVLGANFAYTDSGYEDFPGAASSCPALGGNIEVNSAGRSLCNYEGLPLIFAPEYKAATYLEYSADNFIGAWGVRSRFDANYSDKYYVENNFIEDLAQDDFTTFNASIHFSSPDEKYRLGLVAKNITEEHVIAFGSHGRESAYIAPKAPREIALQFSYSY